MGLRGLWDHWMVQLSEKQFAVAYPWFCICSVASFFISIAIANYLFRDMYWSDKLNSRAYLGSLIGILLLVYAVLMLSLKLIVKNFL